MIIVIVFYSFFDWAPAQQQSSPFVFIVINIIVL